MVLWWLTVMPSSSRLLSALTSMAMITATETMWWSRWTFM